MSKEIVSSQNTPSKENTCHSSPFDRSFFDWSCNAHTWFNVNSPFHLLSLNRHLQKCSWRQYQSLWLSLEIKADGSIATHQNQFLKEWAESILTPTSLWWCPLLWLGTQRPCSRVSKLGLRETMAGIQFNVSKVVVCLNVPLLGWVSTTHYVSSLSILGDSISKSTK